MESRFRWRALHTQSSAIRLFYPTLWRHPISTYEKSNQVCFSCLWIFNEIQTMQFDKTKTIGIFDGVYVYSNGRNIWSLMIDKHVLRRIWRHACFCSYLVFIEIDEYCVEKTIRYLFLFIYWNDLMSRKTRLIWQHRLLFVHAMCVLELVLREKFTESAFKTMKFFFSKNHVQIK